MANVRRTSDEENFQPLHLYYLYFNNFNYDTIIYTLNHIKKNTSESLNTVLENKNNGHLISLDSIDYNIYNNKKSILITHRIMQEI